ncbi:MAG: HlyD family efflux transporter periplasmic adaptor subunit [Minisyncoccota bacterium]
MTKTESKKYFSVKQIVELIVVALVVMAVALGWYYWTAVRTVVYTDKAEISAPLVAISPETAGVVKQILVKDGDMVPPNTPVARIDADYLITASGGMVVGTQNVIGGYVPAGAPVVTMINPNDLRVIARVDETNDLQSIRPGAPVVFTVDSFGSQKFSGMVEEIVPTARQTSVAFSISDKRETKEFFVKIKYDTSAYPQVLNGMSARVWITKE